MIQVGTKFSSEPRNGYKHVYQIVDKDSNGYTVRNTSFPKVVKIEIVISSDLFKELISIFNKSLPVHLYFLHHIH